MDVDHKRQGLTGDAEEEVAVGDLDATGKGFELAEGGAGFGEATGGKAETNEDTAEGVGGGVAGVDQNAGTMGNVAEVEFLEAMTGAVVEFEAVGGKRDSGVGGVVEGVFGGIAGRFKGADVKLVTVEDGTEGAVGVEFFTDEYEGVEVGLHGLGVLRFGTIVFTGFLFAGNGALFLAVAVTGFAVEDVGINEEVVATAAVVGAFFHGRKCLQGFERGLTCAQA